MKVLVGLLCLALLVSSKSIKRQAARSTKSVNFYDQYAKAIKAIDSDPIMRSRIEWEYADILLADKAAQKNKRRKDASHRFDCSGGFRSARRPTTVDMLHAGDIDIVAALGDSLTAGNGAGASTIIGCLTEYRQYAWSIGGYNSEEATTLPNILKRFNPNIRGYSTSQGGADSSQAGFNVAVAGAVSGDLFGQAESLVRKLQSDPSVNYQNDWKMVTLFIGGNNLCDFCNDGDAHSAETYIAEIKRAVDELYKMPRVYINLVEIFDITPVVALGTGFLCSFVHDQVCGCGADEENTEALRELSIRYQEETQALIASGAYTGRSDATVVLQPFFRNTSPPNGSNGKPDLSFFAPDCFHFSRKGHYAAGKALWNTLLQPIGSKSSDWEIDTPLACPAPGSFLPVTRI